MPAPTDYKIRFGTFVGWVILLTILGIGSYYGYRAYHAYNAGYAKGAIAGKEFVSIARAQNLHAMGWTNGLGDFIKRKQQHLEKDPSGLQWFYVNGWDEGLHSVTDSTPH
jgi:cytochrome c-type biogenesis protein CcmH/NrfG